MYLHRSAVICTNRSEVSNRILSSRFCKIRPLREKADVLTSSQCPVLCTGMNGQPATKTAGKWGFGGHEPTSLNGLFRLSAEKDIQQEGKKKPRPLVGASSLRIN
jgi:hypothetical protein